MEKKQFVIRLSRTYETDFIIYADSASEAEDIFAEMSAEKIDFEELNQCDIANDSYKVIEY